MTAVAPATNHVASFDFSNLEIEKATEQFDLPWVAPGAFLIVKPATSDNSKYHAASLRMSGKRQRDLASGGVMSSANANKDREEDRILYSKYVVVGWGGIPDKAGDMAPFNSENCKAFIVGLPGWIFDRIRIFCLRPEQFLGEDDFAEQMEPDPAKVAGN